jgi:hypothetical protein
LEEQLLSSMLLKSFAIVSFISHCSPADAGLKCRANYYQHHLLFEHGFRVIIRVKPKLEFSSATQSGPRTAASRRFFGCGSARFGYWSSSSWRVQLAPAQVRLRMGVIRILNGFLAARIRLRRSPGAAA